MELLDERRLDNGMRLELSDQSRQVAGDRWLVRVVCEAVLPVDEAFFAGLTEADPELLPAIRARMGGELRYSLVKERNFIAEEEKEPVSLKMIDEIEANLLRYLNTPDFPGKLFAVRYQELRNACLLARHRPAECEEEEDDGPADFSACFKELGAD